VSNLVVIPSEVAGWDVVREDDPQALTNHASKDAAVAAAELRVAEEGDGNVLVDEAHTHPLDDTSRGMRTYFLALLGLFVAAVIIIAVTGLLASWTVV
jgi:hypothetical protein